ncbi:MAG: site-2 protease family protein [Planctomycetota bacterium]
MEPTYYRVSVSKATYVECWRATRNLFEFVLICFIKTFGLSSLLATYAITNDGFRRLDWHELPEDVQRSLQAIRSELEAIGFRYGFCYAYLTLGTMRSITMIMLSNDNKSWASVLCERHQSGTVVNQIIARSVRSDLSNGNLLLTCEVQNPYPPEFLCERRARFSAAQLAARHHERIAEASPAYPISVPDDFAMERRVRDLEQRVFQFGVDRGMLVPLSAEAAERLKVQSSPTIATSPAPTTANLHAAHPYAVSEIVEQTGNHVYYATAAADSAAAPVSSYPGVIAELEHIRNKKGNWLTGAVVLGVSVVLFLGAGVAQWDWRFALLLIPILLFHELGHFVAMRIFKYRNMKMFFIPLLGAAVTGQNYNVAGWKKAIVSLAGPVPGIFVGSVLGIVAIVLGDQPLLLEAATLTVFLNAFNLLPFLPLDGGWTVHVLLFSRHHVLDTVFRFLAAVTLILSGLLGFRILMFIGIAMLIGLRSAYRVARVAAEIRHAGIDTSSPDGQSIPIGTADEIISRLDAAAPLPVPDALRAQQTLQVFESVNARPPGVLGTLALGSVHAGSFVVGLIFFLTFTIAQQTDLGDFLRAAATAPQNHYECGTAKQWPAAADRLPAGTASTIVATFGSADEADAAFADAKSDLPEGAIVTHFGQSVLVTLDAASPQIADLTLQFESVGATVEIATPTESLVLTVDVTLETGEQAAALEKEAMEYFSLPKEMAAIPPWDAQRTLTDPQELARRTYHELANFSPYENERYAEVSARWMDSFAQADRAKSQAIFEEQQALERELRQEHMDRLLGRDDVDKHVIEIYLRQPEMPDLGESATVAVPAEGEEELDADAKGPADEIEAAQHPARLAWLAEHRAWCRELGSLMGQLPFAGDQPISAAYGMVGSGHVQRAGLMLRFWIHFNQPDDGALALANWLCGYNCVDVKYAFGDYE